VVWWSSARGGLRGKSEVRAGQGSYHQGTAGWEGSEIRDWTSAGHDRFWGHDRNSSWDFGSCPPSRNGSCPKRRKLRKSGNFPWGARCTGRLGGCSEARFQACFQTSSDAGSETSFEPGSDSGFAASFGLSHATSFHASYAASSAASFQTNSYPSFQTSSDRSFPGCSVGSSQTSFPASFPLLGLSRTWDFVLRISLFTLWRSPASLAGVARGASGRAQ
jgi:hypothetical protein